MKRYLKAGLAGLFILLLLLGGFTVHTIVKTQSYGGLINYVGIVRGATQRLVKLELEDRPNDEMMGYLDDILKELTTGEGQYHLPLPGDVDYRQKLAGLDAMWGQLKTEILEYRAERDNEDKLLALSEQYFNQANDTVFAAEAYSNRQIHGLLRNCLVMLGIMAITWIFIFWAASRKLLLLEDANKTLNDLTRRDPLTGVYQFEAFKEKAQSIIDGDSQGRFAVVYTDFADFKYVNDVFSYDYGDVILAEYGRILSEGLHIGEICGRVSADNFVLLMRYEEKAEVADRRCRDDQRMADYMYTTWHQGSLPTYCGICCIEDVIEDLKIEGLLDRANFARKTVKNGTNPNYVYYDESIRNRLWREKEVESQMLAALEHREFQVYYQPKVELETGKIACSEALVRWCSQDGSVIAPDMFIPVFERKLLIDRLDQYVFEEVCRWLRHLLDQGIRALPVSVNVSRLQFYNQDFVARYVEIRDRYRIPPELLEVEFTESVVFDNTPLMMHIVKALKAAGFSCSIDDFGKGYSSLGMLKNLPVDVLKIDRIFFMNGDSYERDLVVVEGIVDIVKKLQICTVAEGIETPEQVEYLKRIGCDMVQGYIFYRPMPQADFENLLKKRLINRTDRRNWI